MHVRRARRALGARSPGGEFKARYARHRVIERFLTALAAEDFFLYVVAVEKRTYRKAAGEELYRQAVARGVWHCVRQSPHLRLVMDKRYTNRRQQIALEMTIRETIAGIANQVVVIETIDSTALSELQAVDFVGWAFGQKYERADDRFVRILAERVAVEEVLK